MNLGSDPIASLMMGEMGIKEALVGDTPVYTREGGYVYIELNTKEN